METIDRISSGGSKPQPPIAGTEVIASKLRGAGFELTFRPGGAAESASNTPVAFIEVKLSKADLKEVKSIINDTDVDTPHRFITPEDTTALPDWRSTAKMPTGEMEAGTALIIPSQCRSPTPNEKAKSRASFL